MVDPKGSAADYQAVIVMAEERLARAGDLLEQAKRIGCDGEAALRQTFDENVARLRLEYESSLAALRHQQAADLISLQTDFTAALVVLRQARQRAWRKAWKAHHAGRPSNEPPFARLEWALDRVPPERRPNVSMLRSRARWPLNHLAVLQDPDAPEFGLLCVTDAVEANHYRLSMIDDPGQDIFPIECLCCVAHGQRMYCPGNDRAAFAEGLLSSCRELGVTRVYARKASAAGQDLVDRLQGIEFKEAVPYYREHVAERNGTDFASPFRLYSVC